MKCNIVTDPKLLNGAVFGAHVPGAIDNGYDVVMESKSFKWDSCNYFLFAKTLSTLEDHSDSIC